MRRTLPVILLALLLLLPQSAAADATARIIVKRQPGLSAGERADVRRDAGVRLAERLSVARTEVVEAAAGGARRALRRLERDPDVESAELDRPVRALSNDPGFSWLWGLHNPGTLTFDGVTAVEGADIDAPGAWAASTGAGVTVAVVDTGLHASHEDLAGRAVAGWNFVDATTTRGTATATARTWRARSPRSRTTAWGSPAWRPMPR